MMQSAGTNSSPTASARAWPLTSPRQGKVRAREGCARTAYRARADGRRSGPGHAALRGRDGRLRQPDRHGGIGREGARR
eukprot:12043655-Alexandrium_andersonii.AAC.1